MVSGGGGRRSASAEAGDSTKHRWSYVRGRDKNRTDRLQWPGSAARTRATQGGSRVVWHAKWDKWGERRRSGHASSRASSSQDAVFVRRSSPGSIETASTPSLASHTYAASHWWPPRKTGKPAATDGGSRQTRVYRDMYLHAWVRTGLVRHVRLDCSSWREGPKARSG